MIEFEYIFLAFQKIFVHFISADEIINEDHLNDKLNQIRFKVKLTNKYVLQIYYKTVLNLMKINNYFTKDLIMIYTDLGDKK